MLSTISTSGATEHSDGEIVLRKVGVLSAALGAGFPMNAIAALRREIDPSEQVIAARARIAAFLAGSGDAHIVLLHGCAGCGKTYEATRAGVTVHAAGAYARFITSVDFLTRVTSTYTRGSAESADDVLSELQSAPLLVLDDLGAEPTTAHAIGRIFELINARYERLRPTIITSNYAPRDLARRLSTADGDLQAMRIVDRLRESAIAVPLPGVSLRTNQRPEKWADMLLLEERLTWRRNSNFAFVVPFSNEPSQIQQWHHDAADLLPDALVSAAENVNLDVYRRRSLPARAGGQRLPFDPMRTVV